jgi:hypothetical protein
LEQGRGLAALVRLAMYHTIAFAADLILDLEISPQHWLERTVIRRGRKVKAQIRPHVVEMSEGPVEVADLFFEDGTTARNIRFDSFSFVD